MSGGAAAADVRPDAHSVADEITFADPNELEAFVDGVMAERIGDEVPGASVAIVEGDDVVLANGYGHVDVESKTPVRANETTFRVGSVGKLVTWTAVMQGVEDGTLDLDEDVNEYLDDSGVRIPDTYDDPVTLRHLGTHTAGFESTIDPEVVDDPESLTSLETVLVENRPERVRPPGEAVGYSNYGAALAGHVVAQAYDTTFEEYVQSKIFGPLDMEHSTFSQPVPESHPGELAAPHTRDGDGFATADSVYIGMRPAGSMSATATDMATFVSAHLGDGAVGNRRILGADAAATMHSQHYERHPAVNNWRYGFYEHGHPDADLTTHSGGTIHFTSRLVLAPGRDVGIFVNYNVRRPNEEPPSEVVDEIVDEYDLQPDPSTPTRTSESGDRDRAETVAGEYRSTMLPRSGPLQVLDLLARVSVEATDGGRLTTETLGGESRKWVETDPHVYHERGGNDVLAFEVADGDVETMHVSSRPQTTYEPVPFHERQFVTGGIVGGALSGFLLSIFGWGGHTAWRQWRRRTDTDAYDAHPETGTSDHVRKDESDKEGFS